MKKIIPVILGLMYLSGCGPSKEQQQAIQAAEKAKMDSVAKATTYNLHVQDSLKKLQEKRSMDSLATIEAAKAAEEHSQAFFKQQSASLKAQLAAEEVALESIKEWKLGRTQEEKMKQIQEKTFTIESLKNEIADIERKIQ